MSRTLLKGNRYRDYFPTGVVCRCCSLSVDQLARLTNSEQQQPFRALPFALLVGCKAIEQPSSTGLR